MTPDVGKLIAALRRETDPDGSIGRVRRYLKNEPDDPYMPRGASAEYRQLIKTSRRNVLPQVSDTYVQGLRVDGYRPAKVADNAAPWAIWQANGLDAKQSIVHRGVVDHGIAYGLVLPGRSRRTGAAMPVVRLFPPWRAMAWFDGDSEFPEYALLDEGTTSDGRRLWAVVDRLAYTRYVEGSYPSPSPTVLDVQEHGLGFTPVIRFRDRLDDDAQGVVAPLLTRQDELNQIGLGMAVAMQFAMHRQRWVAGLVVEEDEDGNAIAPFSAGADRLWVTENADAKFGDFAQTDISGHLRAYDDALKGLVNAAQLPANIYGDLINVSADALQLIQVAHQDRLDSIRTVVAEAWELLLRVAALVAGDLGSAADDSAEIRWRDTETRSLLTAAQGLSLLVEKLGVPAQGVWSLLPNVTDGQLQEWRRLAAESDSAAVLAGILSQQADALALPA